jgi:hypothetical protein
MLMTDFKRSPAQRSSAFSHTRLELPSINTSASNANRIIRASTHAHTDTFHLLSFCLAATFVSLRIKKLRSFFSKKILGVCFWRNEGRIEAIVLEEREQCHGVHRRLIAVRACCGTFFLNRM